MASEIRKITLTELGADAGPNFSVQYSTDCITYSQSVDCTNVFLPSVGLFAYCTVDSATQCIKLTSLNDVCGNSVVENLNPTTTTTIPPQSTTTTLGNTTTTTLSANTTTTQAIKYTYLRYDVNTNTCTTSNPIPLWSYLNFTSGFYKIESDPTLYYLEVSPHTDYTFQFLSATLDSCTPATTTTNAPQNPTTTTISPTTTVLPIYTYAAACSGGTILGYLLGEYTANQQFTSGGNCYVTAYTTTNPTIGSLLTSPVFTDCCPQPTTTTIAPAGLVVTNGSITCSGGTGGWRSTFSGGSGTYTNVAYADSQANAAIWVNGGTSGTGVMHALVLGETYYDWSNVSDGTWWVAVKDSNGTISVQNISVVVNCAVTTTTLSPTTLSPTTLSPTTTLSGTAYVSITNQMFGGTITDVQVNGVSITGASFPLAIGDGTSGTTDQMGLDQTVRVYYSGATPSPQYIQVTDTAFAVQCNTAAGTSNRLFTNVTITNSGVVDIFAGDGACP
jgi:hypothetical protein